MNRIFLALFSLSLTSQICSAQEEKKISIEALGGISLPVGSAANDLTTGYNVLLGGGRNFTPSIAAFIEFQYDHFGLTTSTLKANNQPAGFGRFWTFSVSPRYYFHRNHKLGGYVTAGAGLYAREIAFTDPSQIQTYCDPYYGHGCQSSSAPIVASNIIYKPGFGAGGGLTYSPFANRFKLAIDVRYNHYLSSTDNSFVTAAFGFLY
ncbi:MAG TPA: hypothetical protein VMT15_01085 [Bryobacteraceae bacterium]|nr:hypothetical protein [Bryobacteraceae bacterium]